MQFISSLLGGPGPGPGYPHPGRHRGRVQYQRELHAAMGPDFNRDDLEYGNKVLLPASFLHDLMTIGAPSPFLFSIQNVETGQMTHVSVLEFVAPEGQCVLPLWVFTNLQLQPGAFVNLALIVDMPKGRFVKIQPHETEFIDLTNPRSILEMELRKYSCLTKGEQIQIFSFKKFYQFNILEVKPESQYNAICVIETDIEVDFAPPLDQEMGALPGLTKKTSKVEYDQKKEESGPKNLPFSGKGVRLDQKPYDPSKFKMPELEKKQEEWDPRKHRLPNGVRANIISEDFSGKGVQLGGAKQTLPAGPSALDKKPEQKLVSTTGVSVAGSRVKDAVPPAAVRFPEERPPAPTVSNGASGVQIGAGAKAAPLPAAGIKPTQPAPAPARPTGASNQPPPGAAGSRNLPGAPPRR